MQHNLDNITNTVIDHIHSLGFGSATIPTVSENKLVDDLGMDSLDIMELSIVLEKEFNIPLDLSEVDDKLVKTLADVVNLVVLNLAIKNDKTNS